MSPLGCSVLLVASYLLGAIPFGLLVARLASGVDVREVGSGNIGANNVRRAAGSGAGALVLVLDAAKAAAPAALAGGLDPSSSWLPPAAGLAAFLGHCFPIYLRGRGGKGVASALGALLILAPHAVGAAVITFVVVAIVTRVVSAGSLAGSAVVAVAAWLGGYPSATAIAATVMALVIVIRHRSNIARLIAGTEPKR